MLYVWLHIKNQICKYSNFHIFSFVAAKTFQIWFFQILDSLFGENLPIKKRLLFITCILISPFFKFFTIEWSSNVDEPMQMQLIVNNMFQIHLATWWLNYIRKALRWNGMNEQSCSLQLNNKNLVIILAWLFLALNGC